MALLRWIADRLPDNAREPLRRIYRHAVPPSAEPMMYRVHLFDELLEVAGREAFRDKRILEIGPRDGLDSKRLAALGPAELVMIDLPEKRGLVHEWLSEIGCPHRYIEKNFMYMTEPELTALGTFDLVWCTGVLYHNAEQLRFLRKLYKRLNVGGRLVLESSTLRGPRHLREGNYVQIHYPRTYRDTGTVTHLPTAGAITAWLEMVGFAEVRDSRCFEAENRDVAEVRMACFALKAHGGDAGVYYGKSGANPPYRFGDSV